MSDNHAPGPADKLLAMLDDPAVPERRPPGDIERLPLGDVVARLRGLGVDPVMPDRTRRLVAGVRGLADGPAERLLSLLDDAEGEEEKGEESSDAERRPLPEVIAALDRMEIDHAAGLERVRGLLRAEAEDGSGGSVRPAAPGTGPDGTGRDAARLKAGRTAPPPGSAIPGPIAARQRAARGPWIARAAALAFCVLSASAMTAAVFWTDGARVARERSAGVEETAPPASSTDAEGRLALTREAAGEAEREPAGNRAAPETAGADRARVAAGVEAAEAAPREQERQVERARDTAEHEKTREAAEHERARDTAAAQERAPAIAAAPGVAPAQGQQGAGGFPRRPVTIVVPFAAGGPTDVISRLVAEAMGRDLGQEVVVENVTGAGGTIAAARVAGARPDGHTLMMHHIGHASAATLYRRLPYSVTDSFAPLGLVSDAAMTLVARPDFPAADLASYIAEIKRQGDKLNLANSGLGAANHLCGMLLQHAAGAAMTPVVYRGSAPAITEMMAGRVDVFCDQATNTVNYIREGRIKAYAATLPQRVPGLDLPTAAEAGQPSLLMSTWHGLYAPKDTPAEVQERLATALRAALREERLRRRFAELVTEPATEERATPAFHRRFLAEEVARWRQIIQAAGQYAD